MQNRKQKQEENCQNKEDSKTEGKDRDTEDSEEEGEKANQEPGKKKVAAPKKKFEWNENLRYVLIVILNRGLQQKIALHDIAEILLKLALNANQSIKKLQFYRRLYDDVLTRRLLFSRRL